MAEFMAGTLYMIQPRRTARMRGRSSGRDSFESCRLRGGGRRWRGGVFPARDFLVTVLSQQIADIEEANVEHVADDERRAGRLDPLQNLHVHRLPAHSFNYG